MKKIIRLTESDLTRIVKRVIKESNNTNELIYITKNENKLTQEVQSRIGTYQNPFSYITVPPKTKFEFGIYRVNNTKMYSVMAWGGKLSYNCSGFFSDREGNMYKSAYLNQALNNKFCNLGQFKKSLYDIFIDKNIENDLSKIQDINCVNKLKEPYKNAVNWWKNKLNEPAFYEKLKKLNNYTDQQTKEWITKYKNYLTNNISGPFCPTKSSEWYKKNLNDKVIARLAGNVGTSRVIYNVIYKDETSKDIEASMVHEIQHALYDLKPMTPDSNWKKVFPYKVWGGNVVSNSESTSPKEKTTISKYGLDQNVINYWKNQVKRQTDPKTTTIDVGYLCRITELASRVVTMKNLLNKKTKDKITVDEFKKFLERDEFPYNDENAYWLCLCWVNNGMEDIQTFLDNLDKYVVAKVDTKNNDDMKDGVS